MKKNKDSRVSQRRSPLNLFNHKIKTTIKKHEVDIIKHYKTISVISCLQR